MDTCTRLAISPNCSNHDEQYDQKCYLKDQRCHPDMTKNCPGTRPELRVIDVAGVDNCLKLLQTILARVNYASMVVEQCGIFVCIEFQSRYPTREVIRGANNP